MEFCITDHPLPRFFFFLYNALIFFQLLSIISHHIHDPIVTIYYYCSIPNSCYHYSSLLRTYYPPTSSNTTQGNNIIVPNYSPIFQNTHPLIQPHRPTVMQAYSSPVPNNMSGSEFISPEVAPWVYEQLLANPDKTLADIIPQCDTCRFTFYYIWCPPRYDGPGNRCFDCAGYAQERSLPCCWGETHGMSPVPVPRDNFTAGTSKLFCNDCFEIARDAPINSMEPDTLPTTLPMFCRSRRAQRFYDSLVPLQNALILLPNHRASLEGNLADWLNFYAFPGVPHPGRCLNCLTAVQRVDQNPFCAICRNRGYQSIWHGYMACVRCHLFRPTMEFLGGPPGRYLPSCDTCRSRQRTRSNQEDRGGGE